MKKITFLIAALCLVSVSVRAQGFDCQQLHIGYYIPSYTFESENALSLAVQGSPANGFNIGLKRYIPISNQGLAVLLSVDALYNTYTFETQAKSFVKPHHFNAPLMAGLDFCYLFSNTAGFYVDAGAGANISYLTNLSYDNSYREKYAITPRFIYGGEAGFMIWRMTVGVRYLNLGKYSYNVRTEGGSADNFNLKTLKAINSIIVTLGFQI